jgi:stearoyl-CoA 9-desaturase NADPH oxidoreductase
MSMEFVASEAGIGETARPGVDLHPGWYALRRIATRITSPLLPDDYLRLANPLWSARELRGRILSVRRETEDSATLVIKPGWGFNFAYRPGQYVGIGLLIDGRWRWRSYSLTSSPATGGSRAGSSRTVTITVKAMPEGFLSTHLVDGVAPGTIVRLAAPQGDFVLPDPAPPSILFLTAGSGITPVMSMLRTLVRRNQIGDIAHVHSAPTRADVMFGAELAALAAEQPGYRLLLRETRTQGRMDPGALDGVVPDWRERQTWACGPEGMLARAETAWSSAGVGDRLHVERFAAPKVAAAGAGGTVTFVRSGRVAVADAATSLMEAGEAAGVQMPFGCRMGICQSCVVSLADGRVRDLRNGREHEPGSRIQTCVSAASGDCALDI